MKILRHLFALIVLGLLFTNVGYSQEAGIRFGNAIANKNSVALDGVFALGKFSRIHADVSFGSGVGVEALWDFLYRPIPNSPINWYVGVGPSLYLGNPFGLGASGEIGVEYRFDDVPIAIGLDYRPTFVLVETTAFVNNFGFNVRYIFSQKK
jgi:hypothetical protein